MTENETKRDFSPPKLWYYTIGIIAVWSLFIGLALEWHKRTMHSSALDAARIEARRTFQSHVIYRSWNADFGGVYVPVTKKTQPNPYLEIPEREIKTPSGVQLTKINPAFMTRQVNEMALKRFGHIGHITSLNPIRPENRPDDWEKSALESFELGTVEASSLKTINKKQYMRLMRPLITEKGCLSCHAKQGYREGDIRGGISVNIPIAPHFTIEHTNLKNFRLIYGFLWMAGLIGTIFFMSILKYQIQKRLEAEEKLHQQEKRISNL